MAKVQTLKVPFAIGRHVRQDGFACRDESQRAKPLGSRMMVVNALRELQSASGDELRRRRTLMASILDKAFRGKF
ncbi:MAG: hypothetical protein M3R47_16885 [Chloroflexota bacterium]|nr:hypothetical protein [Chloroflexota bacterium]